MNEETNTETSNSFTSAGFAQVAEPNAGASTSELSGDNVKVYSGDDGLLSSTGRGEQVSAGNQANAWRGGI